MAKRLQLRMYLTPFFGGQRLDGITTFTVDRYKKRRQEVGASAATINRELATLSHLLRNAVEWKWIEIQPCKVTKLKENEGRMVVLSDAECNALLRAAVADQDTYCWLFVAFGLNTAMRHGEILRTRFEHLDTEDMWLLRPSGQSGDEGATRHPRAGRYASQGARDT